MIYRIKDQYVLRGWDRLPYAIQDWKSGQTAFIDETTYLTASLCNGRIDSESKFLPLAFKKIINKLITKGIVEECNYGDELREEQKYHLVPCRFIRRAHWSITGRCNLKCRHCYMSAPQAKYGELSKEQCKDIIKQMAEAGITQISLTGGEPLVRDDFLEIVDDLIENHITILQIYTNGVLVNDKLLDELTARGVKPNFSLSFDGVGWHDWLRGLDGAEQIAVDSIKLLKRRGFEVSIETCLHRGNLHTLEETLMLFTELGVQNWKTSPASDSGNWLMEEGRYNLTPKELYDAYLDFLPKYRTLNAPINIMLGGFFMNRKGSTKYQIPCIRFGGCEEAENNVVCMSARNTMYIAADGKILPCIPLSGLPIQSEMPSLLDMPLMNALSDSGYLKLIDTRLGELLKENEDCRKCEYKYYCGGGCRAGALLTDGEYLGKDEFTCYFFLNHYKEKIQAIYSS